MLNNRTDTSVSGDLYTSTLYENECKAVVYCEGGELGAARTTFYKSNSSKNSSSIDNRLTTSN